MESAIMMGILGGAIGLTVVVVYLVFKALIGKAKNKE